MRKWSNRRVAGANSHIKIKKVLLININPLIEEIFSNFTVGGKVIPISFLNYTDNSDIYLTYYTWFDKPENFYDDENPAEIAFGTIDIYSKGNFKNILEEIKTKLKENGLWIIGTDGEARTLYYNQDLKGDIAIIIGSEGFGMSRLVKENTDMLVKIPMKGKITSLNASVSAGIIIYEAVKQRLK